jgi:cyanophycinase
MAQISAGLGLLPGVIVDQHFQQRNRLGRLLSVIAQNPSLLGLGVDEDTAGVVGADHILEVIGRGSITVVDGSASETDAWEIKGHRPLMISGVVLHSLPSGYRFDLRRRHRIATPALHALPGGSGEAAASSLGQAARPGREEEYSWPRPLRRPVARRRRPRRQRGGVRSDGRVRGLSRPCGSSRRASCAGPTTGLASRSYAWSSTWACSRNSRPT